MARMAGMESSREWTVAGEPRRLAAGSRGVKRRERPEPWPGALVGQDPVLPIARLDLTPRARVHGRLPHRRQDQVVGQERDAAEIEAEIVDAHPTPGEIVVHDR